MKIKRILFSLYLEGTLNFKLRTFDLILLKSNYFTEPFSPLVDSYYPVILHVPLLQTPRLPLNLYKANYKYLNITTYILHENIRKTLLPHLQNKTYISSIYEIEKWWTWRVVHFCCSWSPFPTWWGSQLHSSAALKRASDAIGVTAAVNLGGVEVHTNIVVIAVREVTDIVGAPQPFKL